MIVKYLMETGMKNERLIEGLSSGIGDALSGQLIMEI